MNKLQAAKAIKDLTKLGYKVTRQEPPEFGQVVKHKTNTEPMLVVVYDDGELSPDGDKYRWGMVPMGVTENWEIQWIDIGAWNDGEYDVLGSVDISKWAK